MRAGSIWNKSLTNYYQDGRKVYWETLDRVARYQARLITEGQSDDPFGFVVEMIRTHFDAAGPLRGLSLGCGEEQGYERRFMATGRFARIEVLDLAAPLLERQRRVAAAAGLNGIEYRCCDLNRVELPKAQYDLVWSVGTVHHIERLEHLFAEIERCLKPRSLLVLREYVGPNRLRFTHRQLAWADAVLKLLPARLKRGPDGSIKEREFRPAPAALPDPSEAVRSSAILPLLRRRFPEVRVIETGGTLLYPLLRQIAFNFEADSIGRLVLPLLIALERLLIRSRLLPSDFVFCTVARPPFSGPRRRPGGTGWKTPLFRSSFAPKTGRNS